MIKLSLELFLYFLWEIRAAIDTKMEKQLNSIKKNNITNCKKKDYVTTLNKCWDMLKLLSLNNHKKKDVEEHQNVILVNICFVDLFADSIMKRLWTMFINIGSSVQHSEVKWCLERLGIRKNWKMLNEKFSNLRSILKRMWIVIYEYLWWYPAN